MSDRALIGRWSNGLAEWADGGTAYLSVAFTWMLDQLLRDVARWANRRIWRYVPFEEYGRSVKRARHQETYDEQQGLFL